LFLLLVGYMSIFVQMFFILLYNKSDKNNKKETKNGRYPRLDRSYFLSKWKGNI